MPEGVMRDWIVCRLKAAFFLTLFASPIVACLWHQRELERLQAAMSTPPLLIPQFADANDLGDSNLP
jgi:hypothetical protein